MAAGSVMSAPSIGPTVRVVSHMARRDPPKNRAIPSMVALASLRIGRVEASVMMTTTKAASVKSTVSPT